MAVIGGLSGSARRALIGTALTGTLFLAACGGSSGTKAASTFPSAAAKSAASSGSAGSSGSSSSAGSSTAPAGSGGDSGSSFCQKARSESAASAKETEALTSSDPATLKKFEEQAIAQLPEFVAKAPAQIKGAVQTLAAADQTIYNDLKAADFDYSKLSTTAVTQLSSPQFEQAASQVATYMETVCGISPSTGAEAPASS